MWKEHRIRLFLFCGERVLALKLVLDRLSPWDLSKRDLASPKLNLYALHLPGPTKPPPIKTVTGQTAHTGRCVFVCIVYCCLPSVSPNTLFLVDSPLTSYGGERYEKRDLQIRVRNRFAELQSVDEKLGRVPWHVVDASQSIEKVNEKIVSVVTETLEKLQRGPAPLSRMWGEGEYELPTIKAIN